MLTKLGWPAAQRAIHERCVHPTGRFVPFERAALEGTLAERFHQQAASHPDRLAVKTRRHELTYAELDRAARGVARRLRTTLGDAPGPVAILLELGAPAIWVALGALQAGTLWVTLDPSHPQARTAHILQDCGATAIVTDRAHAGLVREWPGTVLVVDDIEPADSWAADGGPALPDDPACLLYTSGTTGAPKGVVHSSRSLLHFAMNYANALHICTEDRISDFRPMSMIGGVRDVLAALLNGASLYPLDAKREGVAAMAAWLREHEITVSFFSSPLFRVFAEALGGPESLPRLRVVRLGSDTVRSSDLDLYRRHFPHACLLVNGLGGTETGTICKYFIDKETTISHATVPIGYPLDDMTALVLGDDGRELAPGEVGELTVRSRYLALGYWKRPDLTAAAFPSDPSGGEMRVYRTGNLARRHADGCVEFLGRRDLQVKIRGHRVELSEVETALIGVGGIREAVVMARPGATGERRLVAYVVSSARPAPTPGAVRRALAPTLPDHMIPAEIVAMDAMPLTPHGKVDRSALPLPARTRPELDADFVAPRTPIEEKLAGVWAEVIGLDRVGVLDSFLELGGDSLLAARIVARVLDVLDVEVPASVLLASPTVAAMTVAVVERALGAAGGAAPPTATSAT
jgi:amino acid adenylation domain-containing protein